MASLSCAWCVRVARRVPRVFGPHSYSCSPRRAVGDGAASRCDVIGCASRLPYPVRRGVVRRRSIHYRMGSANCEIIIREPISVAQGPRRA